MPAYDFQCTACGKLFEARVCFTDMEQGKLPVCAGCGGKVRQFFSPQINIQTSKANMPVTDVKVNPTSPGGCCGGTCGCK